MFFQLSDGRKAVHCVAGETADRFCNDEVDLARQRILHHAVEAVTLFCVAAGYSFVRIHGNELPIIPALDVGGVVVHLRFIAALLFLVVCADAGVCCDLPFFLAGQRRCRVLALGGRNGYHTLCHLSVLPL